MKKLILSVSVLVLLFSCSNEGKITSKLEDHLKQNLKDPSSYEKIESKLDTAFAAIEIQNSISSMESKIKSDEEFVRLLNPEYESELMSEYQKNIDLDKETVKNLKDELSKTDKNEIRLIGCMFKYRAKNSFGAVGIEKSTVWYNPKEDKIVSIN